MSTRFHVSIVNFMLQEAGSGLTGRARLGASLFLCNARVSLSEQSVRGHPSFRMGVSNDKSTKTMTVIAEMLERMHHLKEILLYSGSARFSIKNPYT